MHAQPSRLAASSRPPNVVLILADDLGFGELGCYGQTKIATPHLDRLAREGVRFTNYYSGAPACAPSRCTLLTGKHTGHAAIRDNFEVQPEGQLALPAEEVTLAELLKTRGYATACIGKWGLGAPGSAGEPLAQGFDHFFGYLCQRHAHAHTTNYLWRDHERVEFAPPVYSHDAFTDAALEFVERERSRPFFLYLAYTIPHLALDVPADSLAQYRGRWDDPPYDGKQGYTPHPTPRAAYAAMVSRLDRDVGRLVAKLDELGLGGDTLVLFTSDNGPTYDRIGGSDSAFFESTRGLRGLKGSVFEGGLRVPLLARMPGRIVPGRVSEHVAAAWDVLPTLCELAGVDVRRAFAARAASSESSESSQLGELGALGEPEASSASGARGASGTSVARSERDDPDRPAELDGRSFAPTLFGGEQRAHDLLYWELASYGGQQAVRFGSYKAVRRNLAKGNVAIELYDLASDPAEAHDLAATRPELVAVAADLLQRARTPSQAFPLGPKP
ncbi:MAG: arylsulfatase [Planctomycetes bacterium]|nr:arylsulfatase [Planctomycetota bacterium]